MSSPTSSSSVKDISDTRPLENGNVILRDVDVEEERRIEKFLQNGCNCSLGPLDPAGKKTPCFNWFSHEDVSYRRNQCLEMSAISPMSHKSYLYGHFAALDMEGQKIKFQIGGHRVCQVTFAFLLALGKSTVQRLYTHFLENGFTHQQHKLAGIPSNNPYNRNIDKRRENIKHFLENLVKEHGVLVPGKVSSHYDFPSHWNRNIVYKKYKEYCLEQGSDSCCSRPTFLRHWKSECPELGIVEQGSDSPEEKIRVKSGTSVVSCKGKKKSIKNEPNLPSTEFVNIPIPQHNDFDPLSNYSSSPSPSINLIETSPSSSPTNYVVEHTSSRLSIDLLEGSSCDFEDPSTPLDSKEGLPHKSSNKEFKSRGIKKRCFSCNGCNLHIKYLKNEIQKCGACLHCRKKHFKKSCKSFNCTKYLSSS